MLCGLVCQMFLAQTAITWLITSTYRIIKQLQSKFNKRVLSIRVYNSHGWECGTIPPNASIEERKCEYDGETKSSHIIDHHWSFFSHHMANYLIFISNLKMTAIKNILFLNYAV